jgi:hypothetical protein
MRVFQSIGFDVVQGCTVLNAMSQGSDSGVTNTEHSREQTDIFF